MAEENKEAAPVAKKPLSTKDIWKIVGISADALVTILFLIFSIIMIVDTTDTTKAAYYKASTTGWDGFIGGFVRQPAYFLGFIVVPLFILLVLNICLTVFYYQKAAQKEKAEADKAKAATLDNLSEEQKKALREELLKEMAATETKKDEAAPAAKPEEKK
jgi:uncharacterized membrane protein